MKCRLCGALSSLIIENIKDYEHKTSGNWSYYQCRSCLVCQIDPFPTDIEEIASFYPDNYHNHRTGILFNFLNSLMLRLRVSTTKLSRKSDLRIMDVGAGDGDFLKLLCDRFAPDLCVAVDFKFASHRDERITYLESSFLKTEFPRQSFDMIFMTNYIEHVVDPEKELALAFAYLKDGGSLRGVLPNFDSFDRRIFGRFWGGGHVPRHLFQFDANNFSSLLIKAGFSLNQIKNERHPGHLSISVSNFFIDLFKLNKARIPFFSLLTLMLTPISLLFSIFGKNGSMTFVAKKKISKSCTR